jgi:hypothetical protein
MAKPRKDVDRTFCQTPLSIAIAFASFAGSFRADPSFRVARRLLSPYRTLHGAAASGENKASASSRLSGSEENRSQSCARPAGNSKSERQNKKGGRARSRDVIGTVER